MNALVNGLMAEGLETLFDAKIEVEASKEKKGVVSVTGRWPTADRPGRRRMPVLLVFTDDVVDRFKAETEEVRATICRNALRIVKACLSKYDPGAAGEKFVIEIDDRALDNL